MSLGKKLQTFQSQNKLVRVILKLQPRTHLLPAHFTSLGWLRVEERVSQFKMCLVHKIRNNLAPKYFHEYFSKVSDTHRHYTRGSPTDFKPCHFSSNIGKSSFLYSAAVQWNALPSSLKLISPTENFKIALKRWLAENMS